MKEIPGIISVSSPYTVDATVARLRAVLESKGLTLFSHIDHQGAAASVGLEMPAAQVLIFGHPKAGTPLMLASPLLALDLPLRALVWEDADRKVWISYRAPDSLLAGHPIPANLVKNIAAAEGLVKAALE